jgi:HEAT repeat protein
MLDLGSLEGQIEALRSPAINVRALAFQLLKARKADAISPVMKLLEANNPYVRARAVWLLSQLGERGKTETIRLLKHEDAMIRGVAFGRFVRLNLIFYHTPKN